MERHEVTIVVNHVIAARSLGTRGKLSGNQPVGLVGLQPSAGQQPGSANRYRGVDKDYRIEVGGLGRFEKERDVAHYDSHALGSRLGEQVLPAPVHRRVNDPVEIGQRPRISEHPGPQRRAVERPIRLE